MDSVYAESIVVVSGGGLVVATLSLRVRGAVLINVETTPLSLLIFHLRDMGELWHQPRMPLIKVGPHLPLPAVNKTPLMALCPSLGVGGQAQGLSPPRFKWEKTKFA